MPTITNHLLYIHHRRHLNGNRRHSGIFIAFLYPTIASQSPVLLEEDDRYRGKRGTGPLISVRDLDPTRGEIERRSLSKYTPISSVDPPIDMDPY